MPSLWLADFIISGIEAKQTGLQWWTYGADHFTLCLPMGNGGRKSLQGTSSLGYRCRGVVRSQMKTSRHSPRASHLGVTLRGIPRPGRNL